MCAFKMHLFLERKWSAIAAHPVQMSCIKQILFYLQMEKWRSKNLNQTYTCRVTTRKHKLESYKVCPKTYHGKFPRTIYLQLKTK